MNKMIVACDPGQAGAVAVIYPNGSLDTWKMPQTEHDTFSMMSEIKDKAEMEGYTMLGYIEKIHSMPGQGVSSSFKFGYNYGIIRMAFVGNKIPFEEISPQKWQKALGITKSDSKTQHKNKLKGLAQQLYPDTKMTLAIADAVLIAHYGLKQK